MAFQVPNHFRVRGGTMGTTDADGNNGLFFVRQVGKPPLRCIATDTGGWEHVSVSLPSAAPSWEQMCRIKLLFWDAEDCVMQLHPPQSDWVNCHPYCLHLWRPIGPEIPRPPGWMVAYAPDQRSAVAP